MKASSEFCSGYASAVEDLGREGDYLCANWSAAYKFLKERLAVLEPFDASGEMRAALQFTMDHSSDPAVIRRAAAALAHGQSTDAKEKL